MERGPYVNPPVAVDKRGLTVWVHCFYNYHIKTGGHHKYFFARSQLCHNQIREADCRIRDCLSAVEKRDGILFGVICSIYHGSIVPCNRNWSCSAICNMADGQSKVKRSCCSKICDDRVLRKCQLCSSRAYHVEHAPIAISEYDRKEIQKGYTPYEGPQVIYMFYLRRFHPG